MFLYLFHNELKELMLKIPLVTLFQYLSVELILICFYFAGSDSIDPG
jgi:hypothetical protein